MKRKLERWKTDILAAVKDIGEVVSMVCIAIGAIYSMAFIGFERWEILRATGACFLIAGAVIFFATHVVVKSFRKAFVKTFFAELED